MGNTPSDPHVVKTANGNSVRSRNQAASNQRSPQRSQPASQQSTPARAPNRNRGFQEVQLHDPNSPPGGGGGGNTNSRRRAAPTANNPQGALRRENTAMLEQRVNERTQGRETDFHHVIHQQQQQTQRPSNGEFEQPKYKNEDDLVLETYYHRNGKVFSCVYQNGQRFYLDSWQTQDWQPFPKAWYKEGILVTDRILKNDPPPQSNQQRRPQKASRSNGGQNSQGSSQSQQQQQNQLSTVEEEPNRYLVTVQKNDREGFIEHPDLGRISTYIYEEKRNVHYFYDKDTGTWIRMPISWELRSELIQRLMLAVEEALPEWTDYPDMLAALRASNYDPHECITTYLAIQEKGPLPIPKNNDDAKLIQEKDEKIKKLQKKVDKLEKRLGKVNRGLQDEQEKRKSAEDLVKELREKMNDMEVDCSNMRAQLEALRDRPKTAVTTPKPEEEGKELVDPEVIEALSNNAKELHRQYLQLKQEVQMQFKDFKPMMQETMVSVAKMRLVDNSQSQELDELRELYRKEALQRKLLYNKLQEMRGNIRVFCRCRFDDRVETALEFPSDHEVHPPGAKKMKFDRVFQPKSTQNDIFDDTKPIITSCVDGYNVCIMAYGQTGSGKTHTMMGPPDDPGVNIRSIQELLKICSERENIDYQLKASMVEIYNETIQDLLSKDVQVLEIRSQGNKIHLPGMKDMPVASLEDIHDIMELGGKNRTVASTKMNSQSSRSHLIFMITVEGTDRSSGAVSTGTLTLCDLAGSERVGKTEATGQRLVEAAAINKSLTSLGQVFSALRTGQLHVPYRNSKLTHILQPCLGGDAKACLFVMVSPAESNITETISSLQFGANARQVQLGEAKKNVKKGGPAG